MKYECAKDTQTETEPPEHTQLERFNLPTVGALSATASSLCTRARACSTASSGPLSPYESRSFNSSPGDRFPTLGGADARKERTRSKQEANHLELRAASRTTDGSQQAPRRCRQIAPRFLFPSLAAPPPDSRRNRQPARWIRVRGAVVVTYSDVCATQPTRRRQICGLCVYDSVSLARRMR